MGLYQEISHFQYCRTDTDSVLFTIDGPYETAKRRIETGQSKRCPVSYEVQTCQLNFY